VTASAFLLLVSLKLRLTARAFLRGRGAASVIAFVVLGVALSPVWLAMASVVFLAVRNLGAPALAAALGLIHLAWVGASLLLGAFAEGFDLRALLRYPIPPRTAFWMNVLVAPADLVALFLLPPLAAAAAGTAARAGAPAGAAVALAALVLLMITSALAQTLLAVFGRFLKREWTRAIVGLAVGLAFAAPGLLVKHEAARRGPGQAGLGAVAALLEPASRAFAWLPTTALAVRAATAAASRAWAAFALCLAGAALVLVAMVELGTRLALREAMNRAAPDTRAAAGSRPAAVDAVGALLPRELGLLVARELRYYLRTPQILLGLMFSPFLVIPLGRQELVGAEWRPFALALVCLVSALNLSANQFGLDQTGLRLLFLLPLAPRRLLLAKNLACCLVVAVTTTTCVAVALLVGPALDPLGLLTCLVTVAAALPAVLSFGNLLSVYHPWRMTFRLGGAPPGAMISAFAQLAGLGLVALVLFPPLVLLPAAFGPGASVRLGAVAAIAAIAAALWTLWRLVLARAARALQARRELLIDRLARPHETG
jgi:hypothetical protein